MTALNIAKKTGLVEQDEDKVITGKDLPAMDTLTEDWKKKILNTSVFGRTTPKQKLEIADIYQKAGNIAAMTGDGVNDAPALVKPQICTSFITEACFLKQYYNRWPNRQKQRLIPITSLEHVWVFRFPR